MENAPLVDPNDIILPPLHIELGLMKNFVKALDKNGAGFQYLREKFPRLSEAKVKEGIFVGSQIRKLFKDSVYDEKLLPVEKEAWDSFKAVCSNFLGNRKAENYKDLVANLLSKYRKPKCSMSLKIHF